MFNRLYRKISKKDNAFYANLYDFAVWLRRGIHIPPIGIIYGPVSFLHYWALFIFRLMKKILIDEPVFRYRCKRVGKNFLLSFKVPLTTPNLHIYIGDNCSINGYSTFSAPSINETPTLKIGNNTSLGYEVTINAGYLVEIGDNCLIADRVFIADNSGHPTDPDRRLRREKVAPAEIKPVKIGNNVWIGYQSVVLRGVTIGDGSVIGANSVVISNVPPNALVMGNPAKVVCSVKMFE